MDYQKHINYLIDVEGYKSFALQDKNIKNIKVAKSNCVFYPRDEKGYKANAETFRREFVHHILNRPEQIYLLHYSREIITKSSVYDIIDTTTKSIQTNNENNLADMDDRSKEEKRSDELYIREIMSKNGFLESEVARLNDKIEELQDMLDDAETDAEESKHATMADATTSTIGQVAQLIPTLLDKYFAIQERKNELLAEQIRRQSPPRPAPNTNQTFEQTTNGSYYEREN